MAVSKRRLVAIAGCCFQMLITIGLPLSQFFLVFGADKAYMHIAIVTGSSALLVGLLGLSSAVTNGTVLPTLHVVASITLASLMGGFNTQTYLDLSSMCKMSQAASAGCASCLCAASNSCTRAQLTSLPGCTSCRAMGAEICERASTWQMLLLPYTGAIEAFFLAVPAVFSIQYLLRWANRGYFSRADLEAGKTDGRVAVTAWVDERPLEQEDWPTTFATPNMSGEHGCKPLLPPS